MANSHCYAASSYRRQTGNLCQKDQLVTLLRELVACIAKAKDAKSVRNHQLHYNELKRAMLITQGLQQGVDMERYPEVADTIMRYYRTLDGYVMKLLATEEESLYEISITAVKRMIDAYEQPAPDTGMPVRPASDPSLHDGANLVV